jgi:hypothetical protein
MHRCVYQATSDRLYTAVDALTAALSTLQQLEVQTATSNLKLQPERNRKPQVHQPVMHAASSEDRSAHTTEEQSEERAAERTAERSAHATTADDSAIETVAELVHESTITVATTVMQQHQGSTNPTLYILEHVDALQRAALRERAKVMKLSY